MYYNQNPLGYETKYLAEGLAEKRAKLSYCLENKNKIDAICQKIGKTIDNLNLVQLPHRWGSYYPETSWQTNNTMPTISVNGAMCSIDYRSMVYDVNDMATSVKDGRIIVYVDSSPVWEVWRRWPTTIIEQFYQGMRAVREEFGSPVMDDISKTQTSYKYEQLAFMYKTKEPIQTVVEKVKFENLRRSDLSDRITTEFYLYFRLEIPNAPDDFHGELFGCHVEEEEVTETKLRIKKRMVCM